MPWLPFYGHSSCQDKIAVSDSHAGTVSVPSMRIYLNGILSGGIFYSSRSLMNSNKLPRRTGNRLPLPDSVISPRPFFCDRVVIADSCVRCVIVRCVHCPELVEVDDRTTPFRLANYGHCLPINCYFRHTLTP